jgi:hypothetical protein
MPVCFVASELLELDCSTFLLVAFGHEETPSCWAAFRHTRAELEKPAANR